MFETRSTAPTINRLAINALVRGRHAKIGGHSRASRAKHLLKIASAYSWEELLSEPGIGPVTAAKIKAWVEAQGASLLEASTRR
jgi:DNA uptake protein ComE-like DNA-binding protein